MAKRLTKAHRRILQFLADQPEGDCRYTWLPSDISARALRDLDDWRLTRQRKGRGGFLIIRITAAGRQALAQEDSRDRD